MPTDEELIAAFLAKKGAPTKCPTAGAGELVRRDVAPRFRTTKTPLYPEAERESGRKYGSPHVRWSPTPLTDTETLTAQPDRLFKTADAARLLRCSNAVLALWRMNGNGPTITRLGKRSVRYRAADLLAFIEARRK